MNPEIDIGQVEGAFIMGLGYWLTEQAIYDPTTGLQLNTGTWVCDWLELKLLNLKSVLDYRSASYISGAKSEKGVKIWLRLPVSCYSFSCFELIFETKYCSFNHLVILLVKCWKFWNVTLSTVLTLVYLILFTLAIFYCDVLLLTDVIMWTS